MMKLRPQGLTEQLKQINDGYQLDIQSLTENQLFILKF